MNTCLRITFSLYFTFFSLYSVARQPATLQSGQLKTNAQLAFIANAGQITDQHYKLRNDIDFKLNAEGMDIFIGDGQIHYQFSRSLQQHESPLPAKEGDRGRSELTPTNNETTIYRLDVTLIGANKNAKLITGDKQDYYERYYLAHTGENGIQAHSYRKITYQNIYPHIDWVLYARDNQLKYDFIVHPGGDPRDIRLKYEGASTLTIKEGGLVAVTPFGSITEQAPYTYETASGRKVNSEYISKGDEISFSLESYNGEVVIDPTLDWATYYGGSFNEEGLDLTVDSSQNIYLVGMTGSTINIASTGVHQVNISGSTDGFLVKFNPQGIRQWGTYYGGVEPDFIRSVDCDTIGMVYITGATHSLSGISTPGSYQPVHAPNQHWNYDVFLAKFDSNGVRQWGTYLGDTASEWGNCLEVDNANNIYLSGESVGQGVSLATPGAHQAVSLGGSDAFLAKFNSSGMLIWFTYYGGVGNEGAQSIVCDNTDNIYMTGYTTSSTNGIATPGCYQSSLAGLQDNYLVKFNSNGVRLWGTYFGGPGDESFPCLAYSPSGAIYNTGKTNSLSGITTIGVHQTNYGGGSYDNYLAKFDLNGGLEWATYYGGSGVERETCVSTSASELVYLTGSTNSISGISTAGAYQPLLNGSYDIYMASFNAFGGRVEATYYGGNGNDVCNMIVSNAYGNIYMTGESFSTSGIATFGAHQTVLLGANDVILAKWKEDTVVYFNGFIDTALCLGESFQVPYSVTHTFNTGNIFNVELSDASGSFSNPTIIGTQSSVSGGIISCTIPAALAAGSNYYIRVKSTSPVRATDSIRVRISDYPIVTAAGNSPVCGGNTLQLTANGNIGGISYTWTGPNSFSSGLQNPSVPISNASQAGDYIVAADNYGCTAKDTVNVQVNIPNPQVGNNSPLCEGGTLNLTAGTTSSGVTYSWTGPNGFTSNQQNPSVSNMTAAAGGIYTVTISSAQCSSVLTTNVVVNTVPATPVAGSNSPVCAGQNINLSAGSATPGVSYSWTGPGSYTSIVQNPVRANATVTMGGTYYVTASLNGCTSPAGSTAVTVNPSPANLVAASNSPLCAGQAINLTANSSIPGVTYSWSGPNSFISVLQNPVVASATAGMSGMYTVVAHLGNCTDTAFANVLVSQAVSVPSVNSNSPVCAGQTLNLNALSTTPGVTYTWSGPGYASGLQNPIRTNATVGMSGTYSVVATLNGCSSPAASTTVLVHPIPASPVATNNGPLCAGVALDLFATGQPGATYQWNGPVGYNSNAQNPTILNAGISNAGTYIVTQTVNGCTSPATSTTVVINNSVNPAIAIFPSPNDTICPGQTVVFVSSPNNGGATPQYQWKKNGNNIAGAKTANYSTNAINSGDFFSCELTSSAACAVPQTVQSNNILMTVEPPQPCDVTITANPGLVLSPWDLVTFTATPVRGGLLPAYQWLRNGQEVIGAVSETWGANNLNTNDTISVVLFSTDPCAIPDRDTSNYLVVNIKTGISNINGGDGISLYPNPNNGEFTIKGSVNGKTVAIEIWNALGQSIYTANPVLSGGLLNHHIRLQLAAGIYMLRLATGTGVESIRFNVQ